MATVEDVKTVLAEMKNIYQYSDEKCTILVNNFDYQKLTEITVQEMTENNVQITMSKII